MSSKTVTMLGTVVANVLKCMLLAYILACKSDQ